MRYFITLSWFSGLIFASAALAQGSIDQASGIAIQPSGPWRIEYTQDECHLQRDFGTGEHAVRLDISKAAGQGALDLALAGLGVPKLPRRLNLSYKLDPQGLWQSIEVISMPFEKQPGRVIVGYDASAAMFNALSANQKLSFSYRDNLAITLNLSGAKPALAALQTCYEDLLRNWNIDPALMLTPPDHGAGQSTGNPGTVIAQRLDLPDQPVSLDTWVSWKDYPSVALRQEIGGTVVMALSVDVNGRVEKCRVVVSSKFDPLDRQSCQIMTSRARYTPFKNGAGDLLPSIAVERIRWIITNG